MSPEGFDDLQLFAACAEGNRAAGRELVRRFYRDLLVTARLCAAKWPGVSRPDIEDAVQLTFLALYENNARSLMSWTGAASARTYLSRIGARVASRHFARLQHRRGKFQLPAQIEAVPVDDSPPQWALVEREAMDQARAQVLEQLSPLGRRFYQHIFVSELSVEAISKLEDVKANNIYQWKSRIRGLARSVLIEAGLLKKKPPPK